MAVLQVRQGIAAPFEICLDPVVLSSELGYLCLPLVLRMVTGWTREHGLQYVLSLLLELFTVLSELLNRFELVESFLLGLRNLPHFLQLSVCND